MRPLVVKLTCAAEAPERANQALTVTATAAAAGAETSLWLTGEAVWFAVSGRCPDLQLEGATPAQELVEAIIASSPITVCTQCAGRRGITEDDLVAGARVAGSAAFVEAALAEGAQALVY